MEPTPVRDPAELPPSRPRRGATAWVAVVALLAGAAGGFAGGRVSAPGDAAATGSTIDATGTTAATGSDEAASASASTVVLQGVTATGSSGAARATGAPTDYRPPTVTRLFARTVGGVELRVSRIEQDPGAGCRGTGCPPPECLPDASVQVVVVDAWDVGGGGGSLWSRIDAPAVLSGMLYPGFLGAAPAEAVLGYVVQTDASVARVRWLAPDGSRRDEMTPDHGVAVLAARLPVDPRTGPMNGDGSSIVALDAAGQVLVKITVGDLDQAPISAPSRKCLEAMRAPNAGSGDGPTSTVVPVQPLPARGEQPADAAAADRGVRAAFAAAMGGGGTPAADAAIDDPEGLQALRDASAKQFPQYADRGKVEFVLDELVFTSPTRASFRYRVLTAGDHALVVGHTGTARVVNGTWLITRATLCDLLPVHPDGTC